MSYIYMVDNFSSAAFLRMIQALHNVYLFIIIFIYGQSVLCKLADVQTNMRIV